MTPLRGIIRESQAILLDFDGPLCRLFANYPASAVAANERAVLSAHNVTIPSAFEYSADPLRLLQWVGAHHPALLGDVEDCLSAAELEAAETAEPTQGAVEAVLAAEQRGWRLAVVSNNSTPAVRAYLALSGIAGSIPAVVGRVPSHPGLMKPHPYLILQASQLLGVPPTKCAFVGDSDSDMIAAKSCGARGIGYAKSPSRIDGLYAAGAEAVTETMLDLVRATQAAAERAG